MTENKILVDFPKPGKRKYLLIMFESTEVITKKWNYFTLYKYNKLWVEKIP